MHSAARSSPFHGNADEFWPVFEYNLHVGQRPWDLFFFFFYFISMWSNKMWHHAAFWSSHLLEAIRSVSHCEGWVGGENWDSFSCNAAPDFDGGVRQELTDALLALSVIGPLRQMLGGSASALAWIALAYCMCYCRKLACLMCSRLCEGMISPWKVCVWIGCKE